MKKRILALLACTTVLTAAAQDEVTLTGKLKGSKLNDSLVTLMEGVTGDWDTVRVVKSQFTVRTKMPKGGSIYILQIGHEYNGKNALVLYLEPGKFHIESKGEQLENVTYSGSPFAEDWHYVASNFISPAPIAVQIAEAEASMLQANKLGDEEGAEKWYKKTEELSAVRKEAIKKYILANPGKGVSAYLVMAYFLEKNEREEMLGTLTGKGRSNRIAWRMMNPGVESPLSLSFGNAADKFAAGTEAPAFSSTDINGKTVSLADFKGKYVFVDFWASWCGPCKPQIPFLKAANDKYKSKNFVMLGVSLDSKRDAWLKAVEEHKLDWLQLSELKGWKESAAVTYEVGAIPNNILIGPDGKILAKGLYNEDLEKKLAELIK